ncbi:hypothetical protein ACTXJ9_07665 [Brachybacterium tyrofermentans]|uniref:hypothetical protein n=1 Tax=Brachybacterium tyrofermentans TaxID=47848 RepID=UPI003FD5B74A
MTVDHAKPGVLTSRSELEVSDASQRADVLSVLRELLEGLPGTNPMLIDAGAVEADFDDTTIVLHLKISGSSFVQAERVSQNVIQSLSELISGSPSEKSDSAQPAVQQMSQTLVPA